MNPLRRLCKYRRKSRNASVLPLATDINPCHPSQGATQPTKFNLFRQLVVGTLGFDPRLAQTNPNRGCNENPASSMKTIIPLTPFFNPCRIRLRFFFHTLPKFLYPFLRSLEVSMNRTLPNVSQLFKPITGLPRLNPNG